MLDFNATATLGDRLAALIDDGLQQVRLQQPPRTYLGASRLGVLCERALQYEYSQAEVDYGRDHSGRLLRIFERGHVVEACMAGWLRAAGFDLRTHDVRGEPFGFSAAQGRLQGHVDGILVDGPAGFAYPTLWENKCVNAKAWRELVKYKLFVAKPLYAAQIAYLQSKGGWNWSEWSCQ